MDLRERAEANLERHLKRNPYPGRGLVIGRSAGDDAWLLVYWIMGRSASSQSRRFVADGAVLRTEPTDPDKLERPELTIYEAMWDLPGLHLVTNGDQTRTLRDVLSRSGSFEEALALREREPDAPHYTPRIAGLLDLRSEPGLALGIQGFRSARFRAERPLCLPPRAAPAGPGPGPDHLRGGRRPASELRRGASLAPARGGCRGHPRALLGRPRSWKPGSDRREGGVPGRCSRPDRSAQSPPLRQPVGRRFDAVRRRDASTLLIPMG